MSQGIQPKGRGRGMTDRNYWLCSVVCDGCYAHYCDGWGEPTEGLAQYWVGKRITEALGQGWTTDGDTLHCPDCPLLEQRGIDEAIAMVHRYSLFGGLVAVNVEAVAKVCQKEER